MPKRSKETQRVVNARLKLIKSAKASNEQAKVAKEDVSVKTTYKKQCLSLKPPKPSQGNQLDTSGRMHLERSAANYAVAWAAKGSPTSKEKPYNLPLEERVTDEKDLT